MYRSHSLSASLSRKGRGSHRAYATAQPAISRCHIPIPPGEREKSADDISTDNRGR